MRRILPRVYLYELVMLLSLLLQLPPFVTEQMRFPFGEKSWAINVFFVLNTVGTIALLFFGWWLRQQPNYWMRLTRYPRAPFPLSRDGTPIIE